MVAFFSGLMEYWSVGVLEYRSDGFIESIETGEYILLPGSRPGRKQLPQVDSDIFFRLMLTASTIFNCITNGNRPEIHE